MTITMPQTVPQNTAVRATKSRTQEQYSADYAGLLATMKDLGLLRRRYLYYAVRTAILLGVLSLGVLALFTIAPGPWLLLAAVGFSVVFTQFAFLAHDGAHRQIFNAGTRNEWFSRVVGNLFVGLSYGWWMNKHGKHHANPNKMGRDGDIDPGAIVFTPDDAREITGRRAWWMARQHWFFFPILTVAGLDLHINAVKAVLGKEKIKHAGIEGAMLAIRLIGFPLLVTLAIAYAPSRNGDAACLTRRACRCERTRPVRW